MPLWTAWTRRASDRELAELVGMRRVAESQWCFVEGPTCSGFVDRARLAERLTEAWLIRVFGEDGEIAARRMDFNSERPWLVRSIIREATSNEGWRAHDIGDGEEQSLVLLGSADDAGYFVEGEQFRDPFEYPGVAARKGARAALVVHTHAAGEGGPVVRWVTLRATSGLTDEGRS